MFSKKIKPDAPNYPNSSSDYGDARILCDVKKYEAFQIAFQRRSIAA